MILRALLLLLPLSAPAETLPACEAAYDANRPATLQAGPEAVACRQTEGELSVRWMPEAVNTSWLPWSRPAPGAPRVMKPVCEPGELFFKKLNLCVKSCGALYEGQTTQTLGGAQVALETGAPCCFDAEACFMPTVGPSIPIPLAGFTRQVRGRTYLEEYRHFVAARDRSTQQASERRRAQEEHEKFMERWRAEEERRIDRMIKRNSGAVQKGWGAVVTPDAPVMGAPPRPPAPLAPAAPRKRADDCWKPEEMRTNCPR